MTNDELQAQFNRCQEMQDAGQWEVLALAYYERGYYLNAIFCFDQADKLRRPVAVETEAVYASQ